MLKTIRKYRRSVLGVVGIGLVALAMGGFGVNLAGGKAGGVYAIKVGDREISYDEFRKIRKNIDIRYRRMLGDNYAQMLKSFNINIAQQAVDSAINNALLDQFAEKIGFHGSSRAVQEMISKELFNGQFNAQNYASFLASEGLSPVQFENDLRKDIARQQLVDLFSDTSKASARETRAMLIRDKTSFSFLTLRINSADFIKSAPEPEEQQIAKYYDDNLTDFQIPAQVAYYYTVLKPEDFLSKVPYTEEDIELEYADNPSAYQTKPEVRISQIVIRGSQKSDAEQKEKIRKSAEDLSKKIKDGEKFEDLARAFSQDTASAIAGGDAGWFSKEALPKAVAEKIFSQEKGHISPVIEADNSFYIVRLDDRKEPAQRPLPEVRNDIIRKIQQRDAASVLVLHAQELYESWLKSEKSLADFSKENSLGDLKASGKVNRQQDPEPELKELTANVLASASTKKQIIELGDRQILVEISEFAEESVEPLEVARARIVNNFKSKSAQEKAHQEASRILEAIRSGEYTGIQDAAAKNGLKAEELLDLTVSGARGVLADPAIRDKVFSYSSAPQKPSEVFASGNDYILAELTSIKKPGEDEIKAGIENMRQGLSRELSDFALNSFLSRLKSETTIDVQPGLLAD